MEKLIKIQNELKAPKGQYNNFGKYHYRSCEDILEALKPLLLKHKCAVNIEDTIGQVGDIAYVESRICISDGENEIYSTAQAGINPNKKGMDIAQSFGASSSYARKYALNGLFLIDDTKDADSKNNTEETVKANIQQVSNEELKEIADNLASIDDLESLNNYFKTILNPNRPQVKTLFTSKKVKLQKQSA